MKTRESGMPDEAIWDSFFDPAVALSALRLTAACGDVVEFGCGYGTFSIPAARIVAGTVHAIDVEPEMIDVTQAKARAASLLNVDVRLRDFAAEGTGLPDGSVDYAMLFNILHAECPGVLLTEAFRVLRPGGKAAIMHWNFDSTTPRGPSMEIRPRPAQCQAWAESVGFGLLEPGIIDLPPYHYGMALEKKSRAEQVDEHTLVGFRAGCVRADGSNMFPPDAKHREFLLVDAQMLMMTVLFSEFAKRLQEHPGQRQWHAAPVLSGNLALLPALHIPRFNRADPARTVSTAAALPGW